MTIAGPAAGAKPRKRGSPVPVLVSVNVGTPKDVSWQGRTVHTGVWKYPVHRPAMVRRLNIDGDGQGDLAGHGGEQRAVLVYQLDSYRHWARHFGRDDFSYGQFGENLTVDGLADAEVCIGDRYRIGEAEFEVTQPRVTCYRVGLRLGEPGLPALTKGGLAAVTRSLAVEYASRGIRVNAVSPGIIQTPMHPAESYAGLGDRMPPIGRVSQISDVVGGILFLESSPYITGEILHIDGGQIAGH